MQIGGDGPLPSAFQARINGAKGVWIRSAPTDSSSEDDKRVWIEVNESQRKFPPHDEDIGSLFDKNRWTFEVVTYTRKALPFALHLAFIPILTDRGVLDCQIKDLATTALDQERQDLLKAVADPVAFRSWMNEHHGPSEERLRSQSLTWQAGLPLKTLEKIVFLLESGFHPLILPHLGDLIIRVAKEYFSKVVKSISVKVNRSTSIIGIADPLGVLEPGQIHLAFSEAFLDNVSGDRTSVVKGEVVVTRHPALRRSDMQKVRTGVRAPGPG
jgi:RNA dependent RNA polymerase